MPILHVRSVPNNLYVRLQKLAEAERRSLSAEVVTLLQQAVEQQVTRKHQYQLLNSIRHRRVTPAPGSPDSVDLLREDRRR